MANPNDNLRRLYQNGLKHFSLPDFDTFQQDMKDEQKRRRFYSNMQQAYELPDFDTFSTDIGAVAPPAPAQPAAQAQQHQQAVAPAVRPINDTTAQQATVESGTMPAQSADWAPSPMQQRAFQMDADAANARFEKQGEDLQRLLEGMRKGNKPGAFLGEREFNPQTGQMETAYYTAQGERVSTAEQRSRANTEYHQWWENNTEAGRRSREQRLQREFEDRLSGLWQRHNPAEGENAAEQAWSSAQGRQKVSVDRNAKRNWGGYAAIGGGREMRVVSSSMNRQDDLVDQLGNFDLDRLMNDSWDNLGEEGQKALIDDCYKMLRYRYPGADELELYNYAGDFARQQSDLRLYNLAVEKNRPQNELEYLRRKIGDMNLLMNVSKGLAVSQAGSTGDMAAYEAANEGYRQDGHKILDVAGTVTGFALDPTTWLSAGVGGAAARGAMWVGGRFLAGRGASAAVSQAAARQFATTMTGRIVGGVAGGAANFGTFEGIKEIESQFAHGGKVATMDEDGNLLRGGRYVNEGYSASAVGGQLMHGLGMGAAIGWLGPVTGNVSDKLVRGGGKLFGKEMPGIADAYGKAGARAGLYAGATVLEGTIFSVPEWIEGKRDGFDVWTDNMAMMAGFKAKHMLKSAGSVLGDLKASFESPANGRKNRLDFESRLRMRMDAPSDGGLALTKDEQDELSRHGYGDLRDLVESAERTGDASRGELISANAPEIVSRLTDMVRDARVSEAARAKMYYYATGRKLSESPILRGELFEDGNGGFIVESQGANGVITSRSFASRKAADLELGRIKRQAELNSIELGERFQQTLDFESRLQDACRTVAGEYGWDVVEVYRTCQEARRNHLRGGDKQFDEAQQNILRKVTDAMGEFEETGVTDAIRGRINDKYGVDIDTSIRKDGDRRTQTEQSAIDEYIGELIPNKAKANPIEDVMAEDVTNQKLLSDAAPGNISAPPGGEKPVGRAVMKFQDRPVEVLSGNVIMTEDGTMVDNERSDATIVIRDLSTGEIEMVSPEAILSYEEYPETVTVDEMEGMQDGTAAPEPNTEPQSRYTSGQIKIRNSDGTETRGVLTGYVDENGNHEYYVEGDLQHLHYASEHELDNILSEYTPDEPQEVKQPQPTEPQPVDPNRPTQEGVANVEDYDKGYTFGINETQGISDSELTAKIDNLRNDAERLTDFGRGMLEAYEYEQQRRAMEQQLVPVDAETIPKTEETAPEPTETSENITETVPNTEIPVENVQQPAPVAPITNEAPQVENAPASQTEPTAQPTPLQRIPRNEKKEPIFEQAESPEIGWDALVEFSEGDAATAKEIADTMVEEKRKAFEKAQKLKPKGKTPAEILASKKANTAELTKAQAEYEQWQRMAGVENARQSAIRSQQEAEARRLAAERAEAEKAEREAREEAARLEREALEGIPEWHMDTPENARKRGVRRFSGQMFTRQEPVQGVVGNEVEVKFSQKDLPKGRVAVIEASQLQPSHVQGQRNPLFFIDEAQPKNRAEAVSMYAAKEMAEGIRPQEITGSATAYTGAPTVNTRGEVIQGNNRSDALRFLWENNLPTQQQTYKQYLIDNAKQFGIDPEAVNAMQNPVLVNMLDVDDTEAIRLGQMTAQDTESGGIERIKPKNVAQTLGDNMRTFANMLLSSGEEDASFGQLVDRNGTEVMKWMNQVGAISNTQFQSAFDSKSNLTAEVKNDLQKVLYQAVFKGASPQLEEMFDKLPAKAQRAILSTAFRDMDSPFAGKMLPEIQASIAAYNQLMSDPAFVEAKNMEQVSRAIFAFKSAIALDDRFEQYMPADNFSNFALHLAGMYKASDMSQSTIASYFNQMYDFAQGKKAATLFEEADTTEYPLAEVINKVLNIQYQPAKNGNNNVSNGGADVALRNRTGQDGEPRGSEPPASREQTEAGAEPSERGGGITGDSRGSGNIGNGGESQETTQQERLTKEAASGIIAEMEQRATVAPELELTIENWDAQFGENGIVSTPIGEVKMGENQFTKLMRQGRNGKLGMIRSTLEDPDIIIEDASEAKDNQTTERESSFVFVKTFTKPDGSRYYYFTSVTVSKDGHEVVVSNQEKRRNVLTNLLMKGKLVWKHADNVSPASDLADGLYSSQGNLSDPASEGTDAPQTNNVLSDRKVTNSASYKQENSAESSVQPTDNKGVQTIQTAVEAASSEVNTEPTPAQAEAGNYKKGHVTIGEFDITIENHVGSVRKGVDADGKEWSNTMANTYGYIKGTEGVDGDHIDVFLHENMDLWNGRKVYVVDQTNTDGSFDEHKVMLGFNDKEEAMSAYLANYDATWGQTHPGLRISETNIEDFNKWVQSSHRKTKPFADYKNINKEVSASSQGSVADYSTVSKVTEQHTSSTITGKGYKVEPKPYTNKQSKTLDTYLVTFDRDFSKEELSTLRAKAKALKGWYDRETRGWMLRSVDDAKAFAEEVATKSEDEVADEAPLSISDLGKPADTPVKKVDVASVTDALKTKGEAKLSDHAEPVESPKPKKRRWISDEDADEFNSLRDNLRNHFGKGDDIVNESGAEYGQPKPKQMDAEVLRMGTRMTYLMMKGGLRSFADYCEAMKDELPDIFDDMRPHLKSLYAAAQNMEEVMQLGWDEEMDDRKTVKAFDVYNFDKPGAKDIIATAQHTVDERTSQQQTDQIIQTLKNQRNEQRKKEADKTSADTEAVVSKAEATADEIESKLEAPTTEQDAERLSRSIDKELEEVNKQLALLGYYEADPVDKDFNEAYGYMRNAERKAVQDAHRLATQLANDLGITIDPKDKVRKSKYGFGSKIARSNVAPAGGEVYITLPLTEARELSIWLSLDKNEPWREGGREDRYDEDLMLTGIMYRVENTGKGGMSRYESSNHNTRPTIPYDEFLSDIRRLVRSYLPEEQVKPATTLTPQPGEDMVDMAKRVAADKEPQSPSVEPQLPIGDLFGGLFDEQPQTTAPAKGKELEPATKKVADILKGGGLKPSKAKNDNLVKLHGQHEAMKQKHPDALLLFRSGNNYQVLSADAEVVADLLNLPLSKFTKDGGEIPFTEFPHHALDKYLPQMVRAGKRVAVCEQIDELKVTTERKPKSETTSKPKSDEKKTDVQPRPEETGRGGQQPRHNEPLGEGAKHEVERTDGGRVAQRSGEHSVSDTGRGAGVSGQHQSERGVTTPRNTRNNHAERGVDYAPKGEKARIDANIAAIELAKKLLATGATATPQEMAILRRYSGWGGLGSAFNEGNAWSPNPINKRLREILTPEEYEAAVMSRNSAYYTPAPVIDAMWDIAKALGFKGGNIVEGSAGIGNIIGLMPTDISERSNIHAVEIDNTTGGILSLLYPDAQVEVQGFEKTRIANGSVDLAITNVPFVTGLHVMDESGDSDLSKKFRDIHDFCIAKNVRKLRDGGIGIFITSSGTLDKSQKLRNWLIGDKEGNADVVGVFRMNNQTFGGTAATSDIIVIRKRVNGRKSANAIDVSTVTPARTVTFTDVRGKTKDLPLYVNRYFIEHPEHMGGEMFFGFEQGDTYRPTSIGLFPTRTADQPARLAAWVQHLAEMDWSKEQGKAAEQTSQINEALGEGVKEGSMVTDSEGNLCVARMGRAVPLTLNKNKIKGRTKEECFKDYTEIKSALADVLKYQTEHDDDAGLQPLLDRLNRAYDTFVQRYGNLNKNNNLAWLRNDVDFSSIVALETYSEKGNKDGTKVKTYGKTDIFSRRVVEKESEPTPKNVKDGIIASIYKYGRIDTEYLATQLGKSRDDVKREIVESGLGFVDPTTGQMEVSYEYLSGNMREKLRQAIEANEAAGGAYDANIKALEAVVPMNIPAHLIEFALGSSWIEPQLYERYIKERTELEVNLTNAGGTWHMNEPWDTDKPKNTEMGVRSESFGILIPGHKLIEAALTNKTITVSRTVKDSDGGSHTETDPAATTACATKVDEIRQDFKDWAREQMQNDPALSMRMEEKYNEKFNNSVPKSIPDEFVPEHFGGAATTVGGKPFRLRPHQAKAVIRATTQPVLLAHEVGTGKTYTLITTAMEMRRLGTARKPMIVVQNATVGQFVASAKALYPNAKVLTLEDADRNAEGRRAFYAKIKFNDWDMIVVPQSVFERIPDSVERQTQFIQDKIEEKMLVLDQMKDADPDGKSMIVRAAEREIEKLKDEISQLANGGATDKKKEKDAKKAAVTRQNAEVKAREMLDRATDDVEDFDSMGIDAILVDEAHEYKHLGFATAMQRGVKGVDPSFSKKSQGVFLKAQAVLEKTGGKNVVFATGTPISNTAAEIWTFMRYLMPADVMKDYGIYYFDDFVRNFGNLQQMLEFTTSGKYKANNRFAGYVNLPELVRIWSTVADTVLTREAGGVSDKIPQMEGGKAQDIFLPQTRALRSIMKFVKEQLDDYDKMSGKEKKENSHIPLVMYGIAKAAAVDARLVQSDAEDDPNSKTNEAVRQTLRTLEEAKDYKGTVAIFADNYQNKASGFNLYEDIRKKLVAAGVPEEQIVVMKSGMTVNKKLEIFSRVNAGEIRVVMGSTFKLGTGVNIQERLHTLIHLDAPNRPMDYTQRNGRILRQGNLHNEWGIPVRVLRFGVEDSLDVTAYQRLKTKGAIADSIMNGKQLMENSMENRALEEDQDLFGDITAQLSGSEYAMLKNQIEKEVRKLTAKRKAWEADQTYIHNRKRQIAGQNRESEKYIAENKSYLEKVEAATIGEITVGKLSFPSVDAMEDFFTEQNKRKAELQEQVRKSGYSSRPATSDITISVGGFDFHIHTEINREIKQGQQGDLFYSAPAKMTYSCPELGIEAMPVRGNVIKNAMTEILEDVVSGEDFRGRIEAAERSIERNNAELQSMSARDGVPFQFTEELAKAEEKLSEYEDLMKAEMAAKEAKYAEMDKDVEAASNIELTEEDSEDAASEPIASYSEENANFAVRRDDGELKVASRYETQDGKTINYTSENSEGYGGLFDFDFIGENAGGNEVGMRSGANDLQRQGDTGLNRHNSRLDKEAGEFSLIERVFRESGSFNFTSGEKIESADDVAFIFSALEDAAKEHSFVVLVKDGKPTVVELGMGTFTATMVDIPTASLAYNRIRPDQVYFVHNHPSGNLMCSPQDVQMLKKIGEMSDVPVTGVIINLKTGKYGTFDTNNNSGTGEKRTPEKENALTVHTLDKQIFAPDYDPMAQPLVRGSEDVAKFLNSQRMGDRAKMSFIILSRAGRIVGNIHTPFTKLPTKSDEIARYISERVIQFGGESAILYGDFTHEGSKMVAYRNLKDNLNKVGGTTLLDVVNVEGNNTRSANDDGLLYEPGSEYGASPDSEIRYREVEDDAILTEFAEGKTVKAYRTMQVIDGRLYSPMATKVGGKTTPEIRLGVPEQSEEHPEIIKGTKIGRDGVEQGYVVIDKGLGKGTLTVAYNPYAHTSRTVLNDQFSAAYIRPNLVTVEVEVPESELTSGYRAHMAKDAVGEISWHSGSVSGQLAELGRPRRVILTRYDRPVRIVPFREVAQMIAAQLDGTDIAIPYNVVQPQLRTELERLGVAISEEATGTVTDEADFGKAEYVTDQEIERINARQQEMAQTSPEAKSSYAERMSKKFNTPIRIVADAKELTSDNAERQARMRKSKGFYAPATGEVVIVIPNNANVEDVAETVFHEVVAHKGLREMIGEENYDAFCDEVYDHLKDDLKEQVDEETTRRFMNEPGKGYAHARRVAVDELLGRMAEKGFEDFTKAERGIWAKLKAKVLEAINKFLGALKLPKWVRLGDNELRYMLWRSHEKLRSRGSTPNEPSGMDYVDMARDAVKREELGLDRIESVWEREGYANIEVANKRFNEELTRYQNGEMKPHEILHLGYPRGAMRNFLPNLPIVMRQRVIRKGSEKKHDVDVSAIMNMPNHLASPIFIFQRSEDTIGVLTDMKDRTGKNVCVAIELKRQMQNGDAYLEVNDVRSFHGRDFKNIVEPIVNNHTLRWVDKSKGLAYLSSASQPVQQEIDRQVLEDAAKVIKNFENPLTDDDLRFRTVSNGAARREYDERVRTRKKENPGDKRAEKRTNHAAQLHEAYMDGMRSLRVLQEAVSHETGSEIESHEDAYEYENQLSSRNKSGEEEYKREYMKPMFDAIAEICSGKEHKRKYGELIDYVLAKHGLERNAFMRAQAIANGVDSDKADATDYAGLTALTGEQDVADAEIAAAQMVRAYEAAVDTSSLWKTVNAATKAMLTTRYTSGLLSRDMYDTIRTQYKNYIPLKGWEETVAADVYEYTGGGYGLGSALMKAYGRSSVADDPFATIVTDAQRTIMEANRNIMKQRFLNLALNHQTDLLTVNKQWYVRQADGSWLPDNPVIPADADADLVDAIVKQHEADMLALESVGDATKRCAGLQLGLNTVQSEPAQHMVKVKRNGEEFCIYVNGDPRAARAINGMLNPDAGEKTKIAQLAQEVKNFMSRAFTTWNPEFIVGNLSRDLMFAGTAVTIKEDARYARKYAWNITNILAKASLPRLLSKWEKGILDDNVDIERYFKEFLRNGGETGFTQLNTVDKVKKEMQRFLREAQGGVEHLPKKAWRSFWNGVEFMNRAAEDTTRFGVYMTSRQSGRTISRSISDAKEITVNFNRKGSGAWGARQLNFLYVFFNACMQAMANAGRLVKNNPVKSSVAMASFLSAGFLVPMVSAIFASLFGDEEDDYWNLPEWVRRNNICIYVPFTKKWLTIPIAHELRPFYGIGEIAYSTMNGKETTEDAVLKGVESFSGIMPIDWTGNGGDNLVNFAPTIVQPLVQVERNVDYFGKPIYKKTPWNENDPEWSKAYKGTNGLLVDVSKMLSEAGATTDEFGVTSYPQHWYSGDINPAIVEHLLESYSGGVGKTVNGFGKTISMLWNEDARELRNVPVVRKFLQSSDERAVERRFSNEYFKLRTEYEDSQQYYRKLCENARQDSVLGAAGKISKWLESEQGQRHMMLRSYMLQINRIENAIKQSQNEEFSVQLRERADSLKKELVQKAAM